MSLKEKGSRYIRDTLKYCSELLRKSDVSSLNLKDILGFDPPKGANVFLPYIKCVPITALLPLYDMLTVGIPKIEKASQIEDEAGLTFDDIVTLAHKGRLTLYVNVDCIMCLEEMSGVIQQFVDNDVPLIFSGVQETLLALKAAEKAEIDLKKGQKIQNEFSDLLESPEDKKQSEKLMRALRARGLALKEIRRSIYPMTLCSAIRPTAEYLQKIIEIGRKGGSREFLEASVKRLFMVPQFLLAKALHSTLSTNVACRHFYTLYEVEEGFKKTFPTPKPTDYFDPTKLEFIEKKLQIAYSEEIPLVEYAEIFDSKTTRRMRKIIQTIMSKPASREKFFIELHNSITDYNQDVNQLISRGSKRVKIAYAISDILRSNAEAIKMLIEGAAEKYLNAPKKTWDCIVVPPHYRHTISKWLNQKAIQIESKLAGFSPDIIHLYHTRTCLEKLKQKPQNTR